MYFLVRIGKANHYPVGQDLDETGGMPFQQFAYGESDWGE